MSLAIVAKAGPTKVAARRPVCADKPPVEARADFANEDRIRILEGLSFRELLLLTGQYPLPPVVRAKMNAAKSMALQREEVKFSSGALEQA